MEGTIEISERLATLERRQRQASRRQLLLWVVVILQAAVIAALAVPFGGAVKHPVTIQAGRFEVVDRNGVVRVVLSADDQQSMLSLSDSNGQSRILLRENKTGFATIDIFNPASNMKAVTLCTGTKRSFLELHDPTTWRYLNLQAGHGELGLSRLDDRGQALP